MVVQTNSYDERHRVFDATLELEPREWNRKNLHAVLLKYPCITMKVICTIHLQAVQLWWKQVPIVHHPGAGRFARANVQHFGAAWNPGHCREAEERCPSAASSNVEKAELP